MRNLSKFDKQYAAVCTIIVAACIAYALLNLQHVLAWIDTVNVGVWYFACLFLHLAVLERFGRFLRWLYWNSSRPSAPSWLRH